MVATTNNGKLTATARSDLFQILLQDEDGQNILSIDDGSLRQSLAIEIINTSDKTIEFQSIGDRPALNNYHFCISFRPGTLLLNSNKDREITLKEKDADWQIIQQDNTFYLLSNTAEPRTIESGKSITLTLENIGAAPEGGARGTRVEIKYNYLQYLGSSESISGNKLQYLNIVNQRGKKQVPLYVGFLGSNTILNDGTENELTLTIQSLPHYNSSLTVVDPAQTVLDSSEITVVQESDNFKLIRHESNSYGSVTLKGLDEKNTLDNAAKFTISFDVATTGNNAKNWALVDKTNADNIEILIEYGQEHWFDGGIEKQGITPKWNFICKQGCSVLQKDRQEILRFKIGNLKTKLLSGYANLYVHYENIPGYWDGYITVPIHKGPLVYRETGSGKNKVACVGIGTDKPQAKLHVKPPSGVDGLRVDGNTAIAGNLHVQSRRITLGLTPSGGGQLVIKNDPNDNKIYLQAFNVTGKDSAKELLLTGANNTSVPNLTLRSEKTNITGDVHIGTTNTNKNQLKVQGDTAIAGNLSVTEGRLGIGSSDFSKEPLIIRAQGKQEGLIAFEDLSGNKRWHIEQNYGGNTPGLNFAETGIADFRLFINKGGNLGIGTSNTDGNKLKVQGNTAIAGDLEIEGKIDKLNVAEHFAAIVRAADFKLGHPERRGKSPGRALVDDTNNLYINYGKDWSDGVVVVGKTKIEGKLLVTDVPHGNKKNVQWDESSKQFYQDDSSRKSKRNITKLKDEFSKVLQVEPKTYTRPGNPHIWEIGYIAEEFDELGLNKLVYYESDGSPGAIHYDKISMYLIEVVKKLQQQIIGYEQRIDRLEQNTVTDSDR